MEHQPNSESEPSSKLSSNDSVSIQQSAQIEFHFLTLFPEVFSGVLNSSLLGKAQKRGLVSYRFTQIRDFAQDRHRTVDDTPYGGGEGMLLKPDVLYSAWKSIRSSIESKNSKPGRVGTVLLSPQGELFTQAIAKDLSTYSDLILVCGHYEGVDERFIELCVDREISIGDYVLTGGELPALVIADTVTRLVPGVVGNQKSLSEDSLENGLLKYPQFTKPRQFEGLSVPDVLLGGDHRAIQSWREKQMKERTRNKRPDLWQKFLDQTTR
jgi:tRNA (guanine37-N1)-methyltransferase